MSAMPVAESLDAPERETAATFRPVAAGMEEHVNVYHPVLDHGFIAVKDYMGDDLSILQMARMSYGKGTKGVSDDRALLRYLMRHFHTSPFEGCVIKLHVKLPIFVMRQWVRHRTASLNEYSARYSIMPDEFYMPEPAQLAVQSTDNKQGRGDNLTTEQANEVLRILKDDAQRNFSSYHNLLNVDEDGEAIDEDRDGIARELARIGLPLSTYTQMYWQTNLHNLMHFLRLRADHHAQYEIRIYAEKMLAIMADWVPVTTEAFRDYQLEASRLSRMELGLVRDLLAGKASMADAERYGLSKREIREFKDRFGC
ncbi:FAD-dependent thymidylate synthase [Magnetospirillum sulfuroxidans]|uniref:Flavin-dependent thymidylate synthase n=1 Tax=Magnetospirillum sulfuroxidans TaxID=611300 RepID=A0ABS5IE77_9PROT|nr:FAD-dependent thymidylate synthase [Magnetospirillum sulfuroxidans]MBR9972727.1 FAD-dependent thymidylate synthase [Magnetospirillum sulfuroxidans]